MTSFSDLPTPAFLVDLAVARANCARMRKKAAGAGVIFRPHVKTHKTIEGALLQHGGSIGPITVSTLAEAEFFAAAGFDDITYAVPVAPSRLERCLAIASRVRRLTLLVDSFAAVDAIEEIATAHDARFDVMLKVDCGYHRAGVDPESPESVELALHLARSSSIRFGGLLTHAGQSYHANGTSAIAAIAAVERRAVGMLAEALAHEGFKDVVRSVGSTPTASVGRFCDVEEVRPGNYIFYDAFQAAIGSCRQRDIAVSVLASVIALHLERGEAVIDAGALALSKDAGPTHVDSACGFGIVADADGEPMGGRLVSLSQEHGVVHWRPGASIPITLGTKLRIVPNHSCLTAALFDRYAVVESGDVVGEWRPARGW